MIAETLADARPTCTARREEIQVVGAFVGTVLEWYDLFLYGSLAIFSSSHFFPAGSATAGYLASLATFGVGFIIRPFGLQYAIIIIGGIAVLIGELFMRETPGQRRYGMMFVAGPDEKPVPAMSESRRKMRSESEERRKV